MISICPPIFVSIGHRMGAHQVAPRCFFVLGLVGAVAPQGGTPGGVGRWGQGGHEEAHIPSQEGPYPTPCRRVSTGGRTDTGAHEGGQDPTPRTDP
jgi:hypothetical protein